MNFSSCELSPRHATYVESVFHFDHFVPDHSIERVVPTGHVFVLFALDDKERHTYAADTLAPTASFRDAWVSGCHDEFLSISAHEDSEMLGIQFRAFGAHPYLHLRMDSIANRIVPGTDLLDGELLALQRQLMRQSTPTEKLRRAELWLDARFRDELEPPPALIDIIRRIESAPASKLKSIIDEFEGTQKHIIDLFRRYVGLTPKSYQRVLRFNDVFTRLRENERVTWADVAAQCGFSDQSHFIREFKRFSGFNPGEFVRGELANDADNFFPLDRDG